MRRLRMLGMTAALALVAALAGAQPLAKKLDSIDVWIKASASCSRSRAIRRRSFAASAGAPTSTPTAA